MQNPLYQKQIQTTSGHSGMMSCRILNISLLNVIIIDYDDSNGELNYDSNGETYYDENI